MKRGFALKHKVKSEGHICGSIPILSRFTQQLFFDKYEQLESSLKYSGTPYAIKLMRTANQLMGKKKKHADEHINQYNFSISQLRERVYLKILEDCDDPTIVSNESLV